jgi:hypothetical protein
MHNSWNSSTSKSSSKGTGSEDTPKKPGSFKTLGQLIPKNKLPISSSSSDAVKVEQRKEDQLHRRSSSATVESNKEKLKSFKEMISATNRANKNKSPVENGRRRSSLQGDNPPVTPRAQRRLDFHSSNPERTYPFHNANHPYHRK